jgi:SAM-dependent methyltransferase
VGAFDGRLEPLKGDRMTAASSAKALKLNLGCADNLMAGYLNVDCCPTEGGTTDKFLLCDLTKPWPWENSSVEHIKSWDCFEHLPDKIHTMNECCRVLQPGGTVDLFVPTTDGRGAFQDPTHKSWWTPNDLFYFCDQYVEWQRFHVAYGITARFWHEGFDHSEFPNKVWKMRVTLTAVKP